MNTVALFGGSFDPPHIGHKAIVEALEELDYIDKIIIMPTFLNPFKSSFTAPAELRVEWLEEIFKTFTDIEIDSYEVNQARAVSTIQSVEYLLKRYQKIYLVIGADNLASLELWNNYEVLKEKVTFLVASRDNIIIDEHFIQLKVDENISSTELREKIDISKLPQECANQIKEFYKDKNER
jgi:nicotinate-nucleotide adenylyltransferase